jgi:hypothetical protein
VTEQQSSQHATAAIFMLRNAAASRVSYSTQLAGYGVWSAVRSGATTPSGDVLGQGSFTPAGATTVTFTLLPAGSTYFVNGDNHPTRSESTPLQLNELMFELHGSSTAAPVELSSFSSTPLT